MIKSFRDADTPAVFGQRSCLRLKAIERIALRKLTYLDQARELSDLMAPPGNRLEALKGKRTVGTRFALTINGAFVLNGRKAMLTM